MIVGIVFARRSELLYFAPLATVSLWIAMAHYAPVFNLHQVLWSVPGFSFLRAPGRFTYVANSHPNLPAMARHIFAIDPE